MRHLAASLLPFALAFVHCAGQLTPELPTPEQGEPEERAPLVQTPSEPWTCPLLGDVNGDGRADRVDLSLDRARVVVDGGENLVVPLPPAALTRLCLANVDDDPESELVATVIRPTRGDETFRQRLFVYDIEGQVLRPRYLATKGAGELLHMGLQDIDGDGRMEVLTRERSEEGEKTRVYGLHGYGLRELPEHADKVPPYRFHLTSLVHIDFSGDVEPPEIFGKNLPSRSRSPGAARSVSVAKGLSNIANRRDFRWLTREARQRIEQDGFVVIRPDRDPPGEFHELYIENQYLGLPSFVTTDTALHFTHLVIDDVQQDVEQQLLGPTLARLVDGMRWQAGEIAKSAYPSGLTAPLERVQLRLDVAATLLKGGTLGLEPERAHAVEQEIAIIDGRASSMSSLGVDSSIFVVRGHYTKTEALGRFFKAHLLLSTASTSDPREAALLSALALSDPEHRHLLGVLDGFARVFVGPKSRQTPLDLLPQARAAFGPTPELAQLDTSESWLGSDQQSVSLLARRWPADNDMLSAIPTRGDLPDPLELLAALGSERARTYLEEGREAQPNLMARLDEVAEGVRTGDLGDPYSIGGRWLLALRWLLLPFGEGYPAFQQTSAWADHGMVTAAASWAELRRDTILYVEPPVLWMEGGDEDELPPGAAAYVEPNPELYLALSDVLSGFELAVSEAMGGPSLSTRRHRGSCSLLRSSGALLSLFESAARRELEGEELTREQHEELRSTGEFLERTLAGAGTLRLDPVPVIADVVHQRDPESGSLTSMLMAATGTVDVIVVAVPLGRRVILARGPVFSFHTFESARFLNDEQWREMLELGEAPDRPVWGRAVSGPARSRQRPRQRQRQRRRERMRD